jgi:hypothetical protein
VSLLVLLANSGVAQVFGGGAPAPTFVQWLGQTNGGAGPARYWPMSDVSGATMAASVGGINGTYQNASDLELNITDTDSQKWVGFGGASVSPGHATIATPLQSAAFTALLLVQFDLVKGKHVLLTTGGGSTPGEFSFEVVDDGAGGLKPRVWSVNASNQPVIYVGTNTGTVPVGTSCVLFYVRRENGTQEVWCVTASGAVSQISLTLNSGTPPGSWSAHPAGTWYAGTWSSGIDPLSGVARSLALWNVALSASDINALGSIDPKIQNVVWARHVDAGDVEASGTRDNIALTPSVHPKVGFTPSIVTQGSLGTYAVSGQVLTYAAGAAPGLDTHGEYKITKGGIHSPTRGLTIEVTGTGASPDLPFFGQYYGGAPFGASSAANLKMRTSALPGDSFFFFADRTGVVDRILMHWRTYLSGYAAGDGGTYTIQIRAADPNTRLPITTGSPICQVTGISPGSTSSNSWSNLVHNFTTAGQLTAKQPYCLVFLNTHATPGSNHVSCNVGLATSFNDPTDPVDYQEPAGISPAGVGGSIAAVSGWSPLMIDGTLRWHRWPALAENGVLHYRRLGGLYAMLRYSDGQWVGPGGAYGGGASYKISISGNSHLRERFRVTRATRVVRGVFLRVVRINASGGSLTFSLESGPASDTSGNGTVIEQVTIPAASIFDVGSGENVNNESGSAPIDFVPWTWVPFTQNRTLTLGQLYNARLFAPSGNFNMWCNGRADSFMQGPFGPSLTWDQWAAQRALEWTAWEDSRGLMVSTNAGSSWSFGTPRLAMILFKCV